MPKLAPALMALALAACAAAPGPGPKAPDTRPAMQWDARPEAADWTQATLAALAAHDTELANSVPADIETWCPGYGSAPVVDRRAFWSGLLSAVARYESTWNPQASGGGGRYIGLMQISPKSAANYGCAATSAAGLKDGAANLQCAVQLLAYQVGRDGLVAGNGNRGIGRDWMPLRKQAQRAAMAEWTASQSYCQ